MPWGKHKKVQKFFHSNKKDVTKIDKDGNENFVTISYKIKFIDSARRKASSLPSLVDNLAEGIVTSHLIITVTLCNT